MSRPHWNDGNCQGPLSSTIPNGRRPFQVAEAAGGVVRVAEPSELFAESGGGRATLPGFSWFVQP